MLALTPEEKRVVCFVMLSIVVGLGVKEWRYRHPVSPAPPVKVLKHSTPQPKR